MKLYLLLALLSLVTLVGCNKKNDTPTPEPTPTGEYILPVVFHVLYNDPSDVNQYITRGRINDIIVASNKLLKANKTNITVRLPEVDPNGRRMDEAGVNRIRVGDSVIDQNQFMTTSDPVNRDMLWNTEEYINVFIYEFTESTVLGVSHLPYTTDDENKLEGLSIVSPYINHSNLNFPYSISINSSYIYQPIVNEYYDATNIVITFTHELAHYLGVMHVFSEEKILDAGDNVIGWNTNSCKDTDYCDDTDTYNRDQYTLWYEEYFEGITESGETAALSELTKREDCAGVQFISYNIMDYFYSYTSDFTAEQIARMHHVLDFSPLRPAQSREKRSRTSRGVEGPIDLPIITIE